MVRTNDSVPGQRVPRVLFLTRSLNRGGAERQLVLLATGLHQRSWDVAVACFYAGDAFQADLERAGVRVIDLKKRGRWDTFGFLLRLMQAYRQYDADVVHGYLPVANMLALLARMARRSTRIVWGVRDSNSNLDQYDWLTRLVFWANCLLSRYADRIIFNSNAGAAYYLAHGYPQVQACVIPNGIDTDRFRIDPAGRAHLRAAWGVAESEILVGLIGRLDPMKDHTTFLRAASILARRSPVWRFVCAGAGPQQYANSLARLANELGLAGRLLWVDPCDDMAAVYSALDIASSASSYGEGFPNVVGEAMACEQLCVVTDVGDSAKVVGECGVVVPPGNPEALAEAIKNLWEKAQQTIDGSSLGSLGRERISQRFSLDHLVTASQDILQSLCSGASSELTKKAGKKGMGR